jgi:ferric-dicitrate binding protein FerR (iron transport regulator)
MNKREILIRVLRGSATRSERKQLEQWLSSEGELNKHDGHLLDEDPSRPTQADLSEIRRIFQRSRHRSRRFIVSGVIAALFVLVLSFVISQRAQEEHNLVFRNSEINSVVSELQIQFDVTISLQDYQAGNCRFTGELYRVKRIEEALNILTQATGMSWEMTNVNIYTIKGNCLR